MADQWPAGPDEAIPRRRSQPGAEPSRGRRGAPRADRAPAGAASRGRRSTATPGSRGGLVALLLLGLPLVGALCDEAIGPGLGLVFATATVLGTAGAAALASRAAWWWVLTAPAPMVLVATAAGELFGNSAKYQGSKALATGAARWTISGFPVMAASLGAALLVVVVRIVLHKRSRRG